MKIFITAAILQLFLLVTGSDVAVQHKRVKCLYYGPLIETLGNLNPEDINASICTHLVYIPIDNYTTGEIYLMPNNSRTSSEGVDIVTGLAQLKSVNPDLKLILHISYPNLMWDLLGSDGKTQLIQNGTKWLRENRFDGVDIPIPTVPSEIEEMVEFICEMTTEFDKYGFIVTTSLEEIEAEDFPRPTPGKEDVISKMARCCDHIVLRKSIYNNTVTYRLTPLNLIKSNVDSFSQRGLPLDKILFTVLTYGSTFTLADTENTAVGAKISSSGYNGDDQGSLTFYKEIIKIINNSSLGWNFRRDNETKEPYAFTNKGIWASYEDRASIEVKARFVMEKGLGGIEIDNVDTDDDGGTGRFPFTRVIHDTFAGGLQTVDTTS